MSTSDRELLELAARAAGYSNWDFSAGEQGNLMNVYTEDGTHDIWWPFEDDGDALRLAVKLEIGVMSKEKRDPHERDVSISITPYDISQKRILEPHNGDPHSATRRAIVRAAAEIGRSME